MNNTLQVKKNNIIEVSLMRGETIFIISVAIKTNVYRLVRDCAAFVN